MKKQNKEDEKARRQLRELKLGEGAELRMPMGITVIGGLLFSTLLTLIRVPVVYDLVEKAKESIWRSGI